MNHSTDPFARSQTSTAIQAWRLDTRIQTNRSASRVGETKAPKELSSARKTRRLFLLLADAIQDVQTGAWSKIQNNASFLIRDARTRAFRLQMFEFATLSIFTQSREPDELRREVLRTYVVSECSHRRYVERISDQNGAGKEAKLEFETHGSLIFLVITSRRTHTQNSDVCTKRRKSNKVIKLKSKADRSKILPPRSDVVIGHLERKSQQHCVLERRPDCANSHFENVILRTAPFLSELKTRLHCQKLDAETTPLRLSVRSALAVSTRKKFPCIWGVEPIDIAATEFLYDSYSCYAFPANLLNLFEIKRLVARPGKGAGLQLHIDKRKTLFEASDNWNAKIKKADDSCVERFISRYGTESNVDLPESCRRTGGSCRYEEFVPRRAESAWGVTN